MYMCVYMYVCVYVNRQGNLQIIFPPSQYFAAIFLRGQPLNVLDYGVCCSCSCIRSRTQKYVN